MVADTVLLDVDGTLVDTNYQHVVAWARTFERHGVVLPLWRIHRHIGMGGDQLVEAVAGAEVERRWGEDMRARWAEEFERFIDEIRPFEGATDLLTQLAGRGFRVVLASSGKPEHVERFIDLVDGRRYADAWTTAEDVARTKPAPDLLRVALEKVRGARGVVVGDSTWDCVAAGKLDLPTIALRTGGFGEAELREAGAGHVYDSLTSLVDDLDSTALHATD